MMTIMMIIIALIINIALPDLEQLLFVCCSLRQWAALCPPPDDDDCVDVDENGNPPRL